jgi:hypothetical protein
MATRILFITVKVEPLATSFRHLLLGEAPLITLYTALLGSR